MRRALLALLALVVGSAVLRAEGRVTIRDVRIAGGKTLDLSALRAATGIRAGDVWDSSEIGERLRAAARAIRKTYAATGRLVRISTSGLERDTMGTHAAFTLVEGGELRLDSLAIIGLSPAQASALEADAGTPRSLTERVLTEQMTAIAGTLAEHGQPFADVRMKSVTVDSTGSARAVVDVDPGDSVVVRAVDAIGRSETSPDVVTRAAGIPAGAPYRESEVGRVRGRLERLGIFTSVGDPTPVLRGPHDVVLRVPVTEAPSSVIDAIVGYIPASNGESGYPVGMVNVEFGNLFGSARRLSARWERRQRDAQDLAIGYHEPWLAGFPLALDAHVAQHEQDSTYTRRGFDAGVTLDNVDAFSISGSVGYVSTVRGSPTSTFPASSEWTAGFRLAYDTRDDPDCPRRGATYATRYRAGTKKVDSSGISEPIQFIDVAADLFLPLARNTVVAGTMRGATVISSLLDAADLMRIGGTQSVRGYRDDQFLAARALWGGAELRQLVGGRSFVFLFGDAGYRVRPGVAGDSTTQSGVMIGYGAGIQTDSPIGLVKVSAAVNADEGFGTMKIHVGIVERF